MSQLNEPFRICRKCGKEANSVDELEYFVKSTGDSYDRDNLCKDCRNKWRKYRRHTDDQVYLKHKYDEMMGWVNCVACSYLRWPYHLPIKNWCDRTQEHINDGHTILTGCNRGKVRDPPKSRSENV